MSLKKLGLCILSVLALSAVAVSSASAAATTTAAQWYVNGSTTPLSGTKTLEGKTTKTFTLKSAPGGTTIVLSSSASKCVECTIVNKAATEKAGNVATGTGKIKFESVTVTSPANCKVVGGSITSNALTVHGDFMNGTTAVEQFFPTSGKTFATFEIEGASCGVTGLYLVQGTLFGNASNATGTFAKEQPVNFSQAINTADGGALTISGKPAELEGQGTFNLSTNETFAIK